VRAAFIALVLASFPLGSCAQNSLVLAATGDILLDRGVGRQIDVHGPDHPFALVAPRLRAADLAFGNLECPIGPACDPQVKDFSFRGRPGAAQALARAGYDVVSLANNHGLDCNEPGVLGSIEELQAAGIAACGAGVEAETAAAPVIVVRQGIRVAIACFTDFPPPGLDLPDDGPTIAQARRDRIASAIIVGRRDADVVVASFHWGREYMLVPDDRQIALARLAVASGADVVLGHHPHVLQPIEWMDGFHPGGRRALVAWSLGNFVFDQHGPETSRSIVLEVRLGRSGVVGYSEVPVVIRGARPVPR